MESDWPLIELEQVAELSGGFAFKSEDYTNSGHFVLRTLNITEDGSVSKANAVFIPESMVPEYERFKLAPLDTLFVMVGATLGKTGLVRSSDLPALLNQNMWRIRARPGLIVPLFLHYAFGVASKRQLTWASGSARAFVRREDYRKLMICCPPREIQRGVAEILDAIDQRKRLLQTTNLTLESIAEAIFRSWFVDFEPVKAKAEGREPEGMDAATAALFPNQLEDSEFGSIPKGWEGTRLGRELAVLETGSRPKGGIKDFTAGVPSVGAESIVGAGVFDYSKTRFVPADFSSSMKKGRVFDGDVLLYKDGGRPGAFIPHVTLTGRGFPFAEFCINEHVYRLRTKPPIPQSYLYLWLRSDFATEEMKNRGTGVAIPGLNSTAVKELPFLRPSDEVLEAFGSICEAVVARILENSKTARTLELLRDALLPKLMSGQLRVDSHSSASREEA
jgi:type I restriction enzyme, S subunit